MQQEVEALASEYHSLLPRASATSIGAAYARYSTQKQGSIADQVRAIFTFAVANGIFIPVDFIFFDLAERGQKNNRKGLNDLKLALSAKKIQVALFFATNRLYRKTYRSLQFVEEEVVEQGIRAVFISQGLDTAKTEHWRMMLNIHAMLDELSGSMYGKNIIAALIGLVKQGLVCGTIPFGYRGEPIAGRLTRRGRTSELLVVDPITCIFVVQIFTWYVVDSLSIDEIARRLNDDPNCPPPPRASIHGWRHASVIAVLENTIHRGLRSFGWAESKWLSSKDYARKIPRDKPLVEDFNERYRTVPDQLFEAAQAKLAADQEAYSGNYLRSKNQKPLSAMNGLFECGVHKQRIYFSGARGRYGLCPCCRAESKGKRAIFSHLPRELAVRMVCIVLIQRITNNPTLVDRIVAICQKHVDQDQKPDASTVTKIEKKIEKLRSTIDFILRNPGDNEQEERDSEKSLRDLRQEKAELEAQLMQMRCAAMKATRVPSRGELEELLSELASILTTEALSDLEQARRLRRILDMLTGGVIHLYQAGEAASHRGWLQGRFKLQVLTALSSLATGLPSVEDGEEEVTVDFRREPKAMIITPEFLREVKRLYELNMPIKAIQKQLSCGYAKVAKARKMLNDGSAAKLPHPNTRRSAPDYQFEKQPLYRAVSDQVKALADEGKLIHEIAKELDLDRNTVTASLRYWHEVRGQQAPDGRARRKQLNAERKARENAGGAAA